MHKAALPGSKGRHMCMDPWSCACDPRAHMHGYLHVWLQTLVRMCGSPVICVISVWVTPTPCACAGQLLKTGRTILALCTLFPRPVCTFPSNKLLSGFVPVLCSPLTRIRSFHPHLSSCTKINAGLGTVMHAFIPTLRKQSVCEIKASPIYR